MGTSTMRSCRLNRRLIPPTDFGKEIRHARETDCYLPVHQESRMYCNQVRLVGWYRTRARQVAIVSYFGLWASPRDLHHRPVLDFSTWVTTEPISWSLWSRTICPEEDSILFIEAIFIRMWGVGGKSTTRRRSSNSRLSMAAQLCLYLSLRAEHFIERRKGHCSYAGLRGRS